MPLEIIIGLCIGVSLYSVIGIVMGVLCFNGLRPIDDLLELLFALCLTLFAFIIWPAILFGLGVFWIMDKLSEIKVRI